MTLTRRNLVLVAMVLVISCLLVFLYTFLSRKDVPDIGTALPTVMNIQGQTLNFGALVGGDSVRYIELSPDGSASASAGITGRSQYSYVGQENTQRMKNKGFQIRPGQFSFDVTNLDEGDWVTVKFQDGFLDSNGKDVGLSAMKVCVAGNTSTYLIQALSTQSSALCSNSNVIVLQATQPLGTAKVDLNFGGRLTLAQGVSGAVNAELPVQITVTSK